MAEQNNPTANDDKTADEDKKKADAESKKKVDAEAKKKATAEAKKKQKVKGIRVISKRDSFWRAGINFGSGAVDLALKDLGEAKEKAIREEPMLIVTEIDIEV